jgi:hypothetical protein
MWICYKCFSRLMKRLPTQNAAANHGRLPGRYRLWCASVAVITVLGMVAAGAWANRTNALPQVVVLMSADVKAYHNAVRGFDSQFSHQKLATYDMKGDMLRGRRFMSEIKTKYKPDLVLVVGVWALKVVKDYSGKTPLIYTMVLNPPSKKNADGA